jgi:hypothetical protein
MSARSLSKGLFAVLAVLVLAGCAMTSTCNQG